MSLKWCCCVAWEPDPSVGNLHASVKVGKVCVISWSPASVMTLRWSVGLLNESCILKLQWPDQMTPTMKLRPSTPPTDVFLVSV
jgi:hypothetical protein